MNRLGAALLRRGERALARLGRRSAVFMYHRVAREPLDPWDLCVTPENFAEQMAVLRAAARPCDLTLAAAPDRDARPRVAVTFDDGYRDNLLNALPILERYEIPATIFVVSGAIGATREFWWDALERAVLTPAVLPERLEITAAGRTRTWTLGAEAEDLRAWRADEDDAASPRQVLFLALWEVLVALDPPEREAILDSLMVWAGVEAAAPAERLTMSAEEIARLAAHPLIAIGAHTVGHASLPHLAPEAQRREIADSKTALEAITGRPVTRFAFPFGRHDASAEAIVRETGFAAAVTSRPAAVTALAHPLALPRLQAVDGDGDAFVVRARRWIPDLAA